MNCANLMHTLYAHLNLHFHCNIDIKKILPILVEQKATLCMFASFLFKIYNERRIIKKTIVLYM